MPHGPRLCAPPPFVPPCSTHTGRLPPPSARGVGVTPPRRANRGSKKRCVKGTPHTSLAPDDSHGTGSAEPRTTPLAPALVYAPTVRASPTPGPTHASGAHELGGPRQEGQGVTATWETWRPFLVPPTLTCERGAHKAGPLSYARTVLGRHANRGKVTPKRSSGALSPALIVGSHVHQGRVCARPRVLSHVHDPYASHRSDAAQRCPACAR